MLVLIKQKFIYAKRQNSILSWDWIRKHISLFYNLDYNYTESVCIAINPAITSFLAAINTYTPQGTHSNKRYNYHLTNHFSWPTSEILEVAAIAELSPTRHRDACSICRDTSSKCRVHREGEILLVFGGETDA